MSIIPAFLDRCIAPVFSAFDGEGKLDIGAQKNLLDFMFARGGINAYFVRSGMGQMYSFNEEETLTLISAACAHMQGKAPVLAGCSGIWDRNLGGRPNPENYTNESIRFGLHAQEQGAAGLVYTMPEAVAIQSGENARDVALRFFEKICEAVTAPIIIYQPPNTHPDYHLTPGLLRELAQLPNMAGAKVSYSDGYYNYSLIRAVKDMPFMYVTGSEFIYLANFIAGSRAIIGQGCVLNPTILNHLHTSLETSDMAEALRAQDSIIRLCETCRFPQDFYKRYACEAGYKVGRFHRGGANLYDAKTQPLSDEEFNAYKEILEAEVAAYPNILWKK